ncbi:MAG: phosphoribosylformylglycinamidine synthase subunit PurS [Janthinobacterium lividum]
MVRGRIIHDNQFNEAMRTLSRPCFQPAQTPHATRPTYNANMRAHVYVTLKTTVLDAQGQTIANALRRLHHPQVESVRQGKYFVLTLADSLTGDAAVAEVERIASEVLTNPVIEDFTYKIE